MSLGKHWYILPLIGIGLQLSYQLLYLWIENILKCFLHRKRHTGIVDVLRGQTEMDKLLVSIQSANLIKLFLDKILYSLDIVVGNLLDILDTLRIILIKVLIYLTQTSKQSSNIFPSIQVGTFGYMFDVPLMITAVLVFGGQFGARTVVAALFTPGFMNILTRLVYSDAAFTADGINLDPALLLGGSLNLSNDLLLTCIIGAVVIGVGQGMVVRTQATTGGTDIIAMLLQKYAGIKFSTGIFLADCVVILSGLVVIGFGLGTGDSSGSGWVLTLYSLITIFICSRVVARVIDGASYDKLLFIISDENEKLRTFILEDLERSATFIKARGMYSEEEKDMIFLVVDRKEVHAVQRKVQEIDPKAFFVVTDAYDTYGEGFKPFPEAGAIQAQ